MKKCRFCALGIDDSDRVCPHCGWAVATRAELDKVPRDWMTVVAWGVGICGVLILLGWGTLLL
jgi:hypothetical protein